MAERKPPIYTVRIGNIKATVWENQSTTGKTFHTTSLTRSYRDEQEQWHESSAFYPDDLPKIELASRKSFEFIYARAAERQQSNQGQGESEAPPQGAGQIGAESEGDASHVDKLASSRSGRKR